MSYRLQRHAMALAVGSGTTDDQTAEAILSSARAAVLDFGVRRTTLSDVARRAGVSRMTVYNRFGDLHDLMRALMTLEFGTLLEQVAEEAGGEHARARVVAALVLIARQLPANPLFRKVRAAEPELLAPYVFERLGGTQRVGLELVERSITEGQADGSVRPGKVRALAAIVLLIEQSFVFSASIVPGSTRGELLAELETALHGALAPSGPSP
jgi:AcrR family transcriptional regulator